MAFAGSLGHERSRAHPDSAEFPARSLPVRLFDPRRNLDRIPDTAKLATESPHSGGPGRYLRNRDHAVHAKRYLSATASGSRVILPARVDHGTPASRGDPPHHIGRRSGCADADVPTASIAQQPIEAPDHRHPDRPHLYRINPGRNGVAASRQFTTSPEPVHVDALGLESFHQEQIWWGHRRDFDHPRREDFHRFYLLEGLAKRVQSRPVRFQTHKYWRNDS